MLTYDEPLKQVLLSSAVKQVFEYIQVWNFTSKQLTEEGSENLLENASEITFFIPTQQKPF